MAARFCSGLFVCLAASASGAVEVGGGMPLVLTIHATSHYDAGYEQGRGARDNIRMWLNSEEVRRVRQWVRGAGRSAFERLKADNTELFPQYVEEMRGIAGGSDSDIDDIWTVNMLPELESLMGSVPTHCSDFFAIAEGGYKNGFFHGHNEDWPGPVRDLWYMVELSGVEQCTGLAYPGVLIGFAPTWNDHGVYLTQNSVFPRHTRPGGAASALAQRHALCGPAGSKGLGAIEAAMTSMAWSSGASVNLVDLRARHMANVEVYDNLVAGRRVTEAMGNYSHFNMYKHLAIHGGDPIDGPEASTLHRQARADALPGPRSWEDVLSRLSDDADAAFPIFRANMTMATFVLDGDTGRLDVWAGDKASLTRPSLTWNILGSEARTAPAVLIV